MNQPCGQDLLSGPVGDAPRDLLPGSRPGTRLVPQGSLVRGAAFALDVVLVSGVAKLPPLGHAATAQALGVSIMALLFIYCAVLEGAFGTTVGKRLFGMRVVRACDGQRCGVVAALVRTALRLVDNVLFSLPGLIAITSSPRCQRYGDRVAKTMVVAEIPEMVLYVAPAGGQSRP
jgi:uncharacterized RDD family membrane protein YckC